jgi:hypothetical protein
MIGSYKDHGKLNRKAVARTEVATKQEIVDFLRDSKPLNHKEALELLNNHFGQKYLPSNFQEYINNHFPSN